MPYRVVFVYELMGLPSHKGVNGFLMTQRQMTLKDECAYNVSKLHRPRISDSFLADTISMT